MAARKIIVSAPRSGRNWLRFWINEIEGFDHYSRGANPSLLLSHDPLGLRRHSLLSRLRGHKAWRRIDPDETRDGATVLILRDPAEVFVRASNKDYGRFVSYASCLRFLGLARGKARVFHYEDLVARPETMHEALAFLGVTPARGGALPSVEDMRATWAEAGRKSSAIYADRHTSGTRTKADPTDFRFHQRALPPEELGALWAYLGRELTAEEIRHLDRYRPAGATAPDPAA